jgi:long-chain acyl-CoA synthetase
MAKQVANLVELLEESCLRHAQRELFGVRQQGQWHWTSYAEFKRLVDDFRSGLAALGISAADRVGIIANNCLEWAVAAYAVYGLRAALVPMFEVQRLDDWRFVLADCDAKLTICATPQMVEQIEAVRAELPALQHLIGLSLPDTDPRSYAAVLSRGAKQPQSAQRPDPDEVAGLIYTSGTTGEPKGVILTHRNICSNVNGIHALLEFEPDDRSLSFLPWAHSFGQTVELHDLVSTGSAIAINDDLARLVENLAEVKPTVLFAVPRIFNRIYEGVHRQMAARPAPVQRLFRSALRTATRRANRAPVGLVESVLHAWADRLIFSKIRAKFGGRLKYAVSGSAALTREVAEFVDALGIAVYEGYGLTETSPVVSSNGPGRRKFGSVGKPLPDVRIAIDTSVCEEPDQGEIVVYGPNVMRGYHNRPEENAGVFTPDGGLRTGDLGHLDEDGYLFITGRIKEQYKLENGKYVVPSPLEEELKLSPFIANVMVYGANRPHNVALVVPDQQALEQWARANSVPLQDGLEQSSVRELFQRELARCSRAFKSFEKPRGFALIAEDFTINNGLLTPSLKLKRPHVVAKYQSVLEQLY